MDFLTACRGHLQEGRLEVGSFRTASRRLFQAVDLVGVVWELYRRLPPVNYRAVIRLGAPRQEVHVKFLQGLNYRQFNYCSIFLFKL